ncbi:MAG: Gfo/Idh/MocA family oxidoreductase [Acidimicrobiales bacterium]|jgi:predicted dehydrogenase
MTTPLRWGIIGTGGIAHTFAHGLAQTDDVVSAVGSRSQESAEAFGAEFDVPGRYGSYQSVVEDPAVDVVYVATPHPMHCENALLALKNGKPVLVEKPFTMTADEARELVSVARTENLFLMEAMWTRFLPHVIAVRELLAKGVLGDIVSVEADHGQWFEKDPNFRLFAPELGGGALLDLGVYPVSFASMVLGTPKSVTANVTPAFTGVDATTSMLFGYEGGAQAILTCTLLARSETRASIVGTDGRIEILGDFYAPTSFILKLRDGDSELFEFSTQGRGLHYQAIEVARCIRAGELESASMPLDESISIMETMEKVLRFL